MPFLLHRGASPPVSTPQPQTQQSLTIPVLPELSSWTPCAGPRLTCVQMRWSVGSRGSGLHAPRYWVSRTRSPFWHDASAPPRKSSRPQPGGPWGRNPGQPCRSLGPWQDSDQSPPGRARLTALPLFMSSGEDARPRPSPYLLCPTAAPVPVPSAHLSVNNFHSCAVPHSQHPGMSGEVCPAPGRRVTEHEGLRVLVDLLQPWGDRPAMGGDTG